jgi:hypothetical protein
MKGDHSVWKFDLPISVGSPTISDVVEQVRTTADLFTPQRLIANQLFYVCGSWVCYCCSSESSDYPE